jgi:cation diffusion facilitator CzcD-associated flavoprotein CzcO
MPARDPIADFLRRVLPGRWSGPVVRWFKALATLAFFELRQRRPDFVKRLIHKQLERQLPADYDIGIHFTPRYKPWDQRFCIVPDGDLFKAISAGSVSIVTDEIESFTENGLRLASGQEIHADIIVTATGLELLFLGGIDLSVDGKPVDIPNRLTYKGMMLEGVPNLAMAIGYTNASWTLKCDLTCDYVCRLLNHMRHRSLRQCTPINHDSLVTMRPLLNLTSGYIERSKHRFPKQGSEYPWQLRQSYLHDYRTLKMHGLEDGAMVFS